MAGIFERVLNSPRLPASARDPENWPLQMQHEWSEHRAGRAAAAHRHRAIEGLRAVRASLDAFNPDFILIWGDDQYENFREDGVAPFCVFALDGINSRPFKRTGNANAWVSRPIVSSIIRAIVRVAGGRDSLVSKGSISTTLTRCGMKRVCRMHSSMRCCCSITTVAVCRGLSCHSTSTAMDRPQSRSAAHSHTSMAPGPMSLIRQVHRRHAALRWAQPLHGR